MRANVRIEKGNRPHGSLLQFLGIDIDGPAGFTGRRKIPQLRKPLIDLLVQAGAVWADQHQVHPGPATHALHDRRHRAVGLCLTTGESLQRFLQKLSNHRTVMRFRAQQGLIPHRRQAGQAALFQ